MIRLRCFRQVSAHFLQPPLRVHTIGRQIIHDEPYSNHDHRAEHGREEHVPPTERSYCWVSGRCNQGRGATRWVEGARPQHDRDRQAYGKGCGEPRAAATARHVADEDSDGYSNDSRERVATNDVARLRERRSRCRVDKNRRGTHGSDN